MKEKINNEKANELIQGWAERGLKALYDTVMLFAHCGAEIEDAANIYKALDYLGDDLPPKEDVIRVFDTAIEVSGVYYLFEKEVLRIAFQDIVYQVNTDVPCINSIDDFSVVSQTRDIDKNAKKMILAGASERLANVYEIMHSFSVEVNNFVGELYRKSLAARRSRPI